MVVVAVAAMEKVSYFNRSVLFSMRLACQTDRYVLTSEKKKNEIPSFGFFQISKLRKLRVFPSFEICKKPKLGISSYNTTFFRFFFFRSPHIAIGVTKINSPLFFRKLGHHGHMLAPKQMHQKVARDAPSPCILCGAAQCEKPRNDQNSVNT